MNLLNFKQTLSDSAPPDNVSEYLKALWHDANNNWNEAHILIQDIDDTKASWIHAYLHRKEGDISNAGYWYKKAGKLMPALSLNEEWKQIVTALL